MYKRSVDDPDGVVECPVGRLPRQCVLIGGGAQRLQPVEQEDEHAHHGDGGSDAGPHGQVEGCEEREDVDLLFRLPQQDADAIIQVALAEVHHVLPLGRDGDGRHGQVGSLGEEAANVSIHTMTRSAGSLSTSSRINICRPSGLKPLWLFSVTLYVLVCDTPNLTLGSATSTTTHCCLEFVFVSFLSHSDTRY